MSLSLALRTMSSLGAQVIPVTTGLGGYGAGFSAAGTSAASGSNSTFASVASRPTSSSFFLWMSPPYQGADVLVRPVPQRRRDGVGEHADAGVAVLELRPRLEQHRCLVPRERERVVRWREPLPEVAHPPGQLVVRHPILVGVGQPR